MGVFNHDTSTFHGRKEREEEEEREEVLSGLQFWSSFNFILEYKRVLCTNCVCDLFFFFLWQV